MASVKIGIPKGLGGVAEKLEKPEFAAAVGLAMLAAEEGGSRDKPEKKTKKASGKKDKIGILKKIFSRF